jgi:hypothetical protein
MKSLLCPHWIPTHMDKQDREWLSQWKPRFVKMVTISADEVPSFDVGYDCAQEAVIIRSHPISENWNVRGIADKAAALSMAETHAAAYIDLISNICADFPKTELGRLAVEGLNEPQEWSTEPAELVAAYYANFGKLMHKAGARVVYLNIGVGWPGNHGVTDAPPDWRPYEPIFEAREKYGGWIASHEYCYVNGFTQNWGWWGGRYQACPWQAPWLITECGIDSHVVGGDYFGYQGIDPNADFSAQRYLDYLVEYEKQAHLTPWVEGLFPFTYDHGSPEWATFSYRNEQFMSRLISYVNETAPGINVSTITAWPLPKYVETAWSQPQITTEEPIKWYGLLETHREIITEVATRDGFGFDPRFIATIVSIESSGRSDAISSAGAVGLMQVMPKEAGAGFEDRPAADQLLDPEFNLEWGCWIMCQAGDRHNWELKGTLTGYFGGGTDTDGHNADYYLAKFKERWTFLWGTEADDTIKHAGAESEKPPTTEVETDEKPTVEQEETMSEFTVYDAAGTPHDAAWLKTNWGIEVDTSLRDNTRENFVVSNIQVVNQELYRVKFVNNDADNNVWFGRSFSTAPNQWPNGVCPANVVCPDGAKEHAILTLGKTNVEHAGLGAGDRVANGKGGNTFWMPTAAGGSDVVRWVGTKPQQGIEIWFKLVKPGTVVVEPEPETEPETEPTVVSDYTEGFLAIADLLDQASDILRSMATDA